MSSCHRPEACHAWSSARASRRAVVFAANLLLLLALIVTTRPGGRDAESFAQARQGAKTNTTAATLARQERVEIARGEKGALAVWTETPSEPSGTTTTAAQSVVYAARLDARGRVMGSAPVVVHAAQGFVQHPRAVWNGAQWLVVWYTERDTKPLTFDIQAARVSSGGIVVDRRAFTIKSGLAVNGYFPASVTTDERGNWFVSWRSLNPAADENTRISGARISPQGKTLAQFDAPASASTPASEDVAPLAGALLWTQNSDGRSVFGPSIKTRSGTTMQNEEMADDFDLTGTIDRVVLYGYRDFNAAPTAVVHGAWVRFYSNLSGQPGVMQAEHYLPKGDPRLIVDSTQPKAVDITLPTPFQATGRHFVSVQLDVETADSYWWWVSANTGTVRMSPVMRRDRTASSVWTVKNQSDAVMSLYGALTAAARLDSLSTTTATRSGYVVANGANFGGQQRTGRVLVDNAQAIVVRWTDTSIQFYVPEGARTGSVPVQVVTDAGSSNTLDLNVTPRNPDGRIRWRFTVAADYTSTRSGVAPDGTIYVNDVLGRTYALTPDGGLKWITQTGLTGADGPVSVGADGTVYVMSLLPHGDGTNDPAIIALNPDGTEKWRYLATGGISGRGGPNVGPDGKIYAIVRPSSIDAHNVFALNPNGTLAWNYNDMIYKYGATGGKDIAFGRTVPQLYFQYESRTFRSGALWAFRLDGNLRWTVDRQGNAQTAVSPLDDSVHTQMQAFTPQGNLLWTIPLFGSGPTSAPDVGVDGVHYIIQNYSNLFAVRPDGTEKWRYQDPGLIFEPDVSQANNVVFMGGRNTYGAPGFFVGVNTSDGTQAFRIPLPDEPGFEPYGQVVPFSQSKFSNDGNTVYINADVAGDGAVQFEGRRYSFFYAIDTSTNAPCSYSITPQSQSFASNGGSGTVNITSTSNDCAWTATSNADWITLNSGASGRGNGVINYTVAVNTSLSERVGTLSISGQTFTVTQASAPANAPTVAITYPANDDSFTQPASIFVRADAGAAQGRTLSRVEFYAGSAFIGSDTSAPYQVVWDEAPAGNVVLTAKAFDNQGGVNTSQAVGIKILPPSNGLLPLPISKPTLVSPQQGATYGAPANIILTAEPAASSNIARVDFYVDTTLLGSDTTNPYNFNWTNAPAGRYTVSARAVSSSGARATSALADITVSASSSSISGRVMDSGNSPLGGVSVTLSNGASSATAFTDAAGNYSFGGLASGGSYTVAAAASGLTFSPGTATFSNISGSQVADFSVVRQNLASGSLIISEFRLRGPNGASDEFVELYNNTDAPLTVNAADGSAGWSVVSLGNEETRFTIPNGTTIPARGHYLAVNSGGYSLAGPLPGDTTFTADMPDNLGLALFNTTNPQNFVTGNCLDAVGFSGAATERLGLLASVYREGTPLAPVGATVSASEQYSFVRKMPTGVPQDSGDNANDFVLVSSTGSVSGVPVQLGAPAPENLASYIQRGSQFPASLIDPLQSSASPPNRVRNFTSNPSNNSTLGTLSIRRKFANNTGRSITKLRFRIIDISTLNSPNVAGAQQADLRALNSGSLTVTITDGNSVQVTGLALDTSAGQPLGGGVNSTLLNGTVTTASPLAPGATVNVNFTLGVQQTGRFRFFVTVEALP